MCYLYNNLIRGFHISNFIFHELSMQLMIELLLTFNRSIKPTTRFLIKIIYILMGAFLGLASHRKFLRAPMNVSIECDDTVPMLNTISCRC